MIKLLLLLIIVLLFCPLSINIIITGQKLPIVIWPNDGCEILDSKFSAMKCHEYGKHLSWLVRLDTAIQNNDLNYIHDYQYYEWKCQDDCFYSIDCLTIQVGEKSCRKFSFVNKFEYRKNSDILHLACCDKMKEPTIHARSSFSFYPDLKPNCPLMINRYDCDNFIVWLPELNYHRDGRDMVSLQPYKNTYKECQDECFKYFSCMSFIYDPWSKRCKLKYGNDGFYNLVQGTGIRIIKPHCCQDPINRILMQFTFDIFLQGEKKYPTGMDYKCPLGWAKQWTFDSQISCNSSPELIENLQNCTDVNGLLKTSWQKNSSFIIVDNNGCGLYRHFVNCWPDPTAVNRKIYYLGCIKHIRYELRLPEVTSFYTDDCATDRPDIIGYNGTYNQ